MSNPVQPQILELLSQHPEGLTQRQIKELLDLPQSTVSRHCRALFGDKKVIASKNIEAGTKHPAIAYKLASGISPNQLQSSRPLPTRVPVWGRCVACFGHRQIAVFQPQKRCFDCAKRAK